MLLFSWGLSIQKMRVRVLNGKLDTLDLMPVELIVESLEWKVKQGIYVYSETSDRWNESD